MKHITWRGKSQRDLTCSGIYIITNLLSDKIYIGQSLNMAKRWAQHQASVYSLDVQTPLAQAMRRDGVENFRIDVLEYCEPCLLNRLEVSYIEQYNSRIPDGYNVSAGGSKPHPPRLVKVNVVKKWDGVGSSGEQFLPSSIVRISTVEPTEAAIDHWSFPFHFQYVGIDGKCHVQKEFLPYAMAVLEKWLQQFPHGYSHGLPMLLPSGARMQRYFRLTYPFWFHIFDDRKSFTAGVFASPTQPESALAYQRIERAMWDQLADDLTPSPQVLYFEWVKS